MRRNISISNLIIGFIILDILFSFNFVIYNEQTTNNENLNSRNFSEARLSLSRNYINLTGSRICIDDRWESIWPYNTYNYLGDPNNKTWEELASTEDWCSGSGTWKDPYVIENIYIDCLQMGTGISIFLSNVPFIIKNCHIHNAGSEDYDTGISLIHVKNGQIKNTTFTYNHHSLWLWESFNNTFSDNVMINNHTTSGLGKAVKMERSHNNTISRNRSTNHYDGINIWDSNYNIITENFIENNLFGHYPDTGLYLVNSNYSIITYNIFAGDYANYTNPYGESIISEQNCVGNVIDNNFNEQLDLSMSLVLKNQRSNIKLSNPDSWFTLSESNYNYIYGNKLYKGVSPDEQKIVGFNFYILIGVIGIILFIELSFNKLRKK